MSEKEPTTGRLFRGARAGTSPPEFATLVGTDGAAAGDVAEAVTSHTLPPDLAALADRYDSAVGIRDRFVWRWFHLVNPRFRLSSVDGEHETKVRDGKTLLTFYVTLVDDLLEERRDEATFEEAAKLPFDAQTARLDADGVDRAYLELTADVWRWVEETVTAAPYFDDLDDLFRYDLRQVLNSVRYAHVVSGHVRMANLTEAYAFGSHNMVMFPYADIDLMYSSGFDRNELSELRRLLWRAQEMARIGNWVSTWERELGQGDFGSGVVIRAIQAGVVSPDELLATQSGPNPGIVEEVRDQIQEAGLEDYFMEQWYERYTTLEQTVDLDSIDVDAFLDGMRTVMRFHLESRGLK